MKTILTTIQQTLTPEASTILKNSIAEASRRSHTQTTPLHVASTLLSSPTSFLRQACIKSHPNSSHPLQCRALELCFSVALERIPTATSSITDPPVSNALMAALKRAQSHQRKGSPENQQQPLLAVKVELEQLIVSILDDPSVSRVMREASFSSPAVKATIEQSLNNSSDFNNFNNFNNQSNLGLGFRQCSVPISVPINPSLYLNHKLQQQDRFEKMGSNRFDDVNRVIEVMKKPKKKNPILVGELELETICEQIVKRIETGEFVIERLKNVEVISIGSEFVSTSEINKSLIPMKIKKLCDSIEEKIRVFDDDDDDKGVIVDVGDLKWVVGCCESVTEMGKLVGKFAGKVWLIGYATCETFLRCQVYYPSMEIDWDLQAVPITSKSSITNIFNRMGTNGGVVGGSVQSLNSVNNLSNLDDNWKMLMCSKCSCDYEQEVAKLKDLEVKNNLPQWLQNATTKDQSQIKDQEPVLKQKIQDLQKKWRDECVRIHRNHNQSSRLDTVVPLTGAYKPNMLLRQSQLGQQPRLQPVRSLQEALQPIQRPRLEPPRSPVGTDLVLGPKKPSETAVPNHDQDLTVKDLLGCISSEPQKAKFIGSADADYFKRLLKGLMKKAWWQPEAASAIATTITQCKVDTGSRGCVWLLFTGPDRVGKKKMASVLSDHITGTGPITIALGSRRDNEETNIGFRGRTVLDRIVEAVRRNPSSVIVLSDIDEADMVVRGHIKQAMDRGRLTDSHGREISLGNVVFVLTGNWSTANVDEYELDEQRLHTIATRDWQLKLTICEKRLKRLKRLKLDLSLDLNLAIDYEEEQDRTDGSINSSNLTVDHDEESQRFAVTCVPHDLLRSSHGAIVFKPVNFGDLRNEIEKTITNAFSTLQNATSRSAIELEDSAVEHILSGLWFGQKSLEEWAEQVLVPSLHQVNSRLEDHGEEIVVRLESYRDHVHMDGGGDWLPSKIMVVDGV